MQRLEKIFKPTGFKVGLLITILSIIICGAGIPFFQIMELKAFDFHFLSRGVIEPTGEVVIIAIDEKIIDKFGRWPWQRKRIAELIDKLNEYEAKIVAFDIVFSEPDESSGINVVKDLKGRLKNKSRDVTSVIETMEKATDNDSRLASALKGDFTTVSEILKPQVLVKLINDYLTPMTDIVLKNSGIIDKYMGDAIMSFWGAPV